MKRSGRRDDDKDRHDVGEEHPEIGVDADAPELQLRLAWRAFERLGVDALLDLLDLLLRLPEEEVGTDRGAENRHDDRQIAGLQADIGHDEVVANRGPGHVNHEGHTDVSEQRERQPLQPRDVTGVAHEHFEQERERPESGDVGQHRTANQQLGRGPHGAQVGAEVDGVGHHQEEDQDIEHGSRVVLADDARDAVAGHPADARADLLDRAHQRPAKHQHPAQAKAELCARLGIGGDAARIVVGGARDQARAQDLEKLGPLGLLDVLWTVGRPGSDVVEV